MRSRDSLPFWLAIVLALPAVILLASAIEVEHCPDPGSNGLSVDHSTPESPGSRGIAILEAGDERIEAEDDDENEDDLSLLSLASSGRASAGASRSAHGALVASERIARDALPRAPPA